MPDAAEHSQADAGDSSEQEPTSTGHGPLPLEPAHRGRRKKPARADVRPRMPELLPVELMSVEDVHIEAHEDHLPAMHELYVLMLGMGEDPQATPPANKRITPGNSQPTTLGQTPPADDWVKQVPPAPISATGREIIYRTQTHQLIIHLRQGPLPIRQDYRPVRLAVPSLQRLRQMLVEREMDHQLQMGLVPGSHCIVMIDPAGNWLNIHERRELM